MLTLVAAVQAQLGVSAGAVGAAALTLFGRAESATARAELAESLEACGKLRSQVLAGLASYEPEVLGIAVGRSAEGPEPFGLTAGGAFDLPPIASGGGIISRRPCRSAPG